MTEKTTPAAVAPEIAVVREPTGVIAFVTEAEAVALEQSSEGRRARPIDLEIAGVASRA